MGYVVLTYPPGQASLAFDEMVAALLEDGWTLAYRGFRLAVLTESQAPPPVIPLHGPGGVAGVLVGRAFDRAATDAGEVATANPAGLAQLDPMDACGRLIAGAWGGYVAVFVGHPKAGPTTLRDPSGSVEALVWRRDEVTVVSSRAIVGRAGPLDLAIDWTRVKQVLEDPISAALGAPPLVGLAHLEPGVVLHGPGLDCKTVLWSPASIVRAARRRSWPARRDLRRTVDACIRALAGSETRILCEISGGLDSAIVATSLAASGLGPHAAINFYRDQPEADERVYARAVADRIGVDLQTVHRAPFAFTAEMLEASARAARPNFNALDPGYDTGLVAALQVAKAKVLFTGHGGDTVFYQVAASALAADILRGSPCEGSRLHRLEDVARRTRRSLWSLGLEALTGRGFLQSLEGRLLRQEADRQRRSGLSHPWLADMAGISPAKRQQISALAANLNANGATGRAERAHIAHPLLSQPVVEMCLAIPAPVLSAGERERSFARETFADRLPQEIVERRSKGDISVFLNRTLAASCGFLRPFLLDGQLAARGLIDVAEFDRALEPEAIVWKDASREILSAAALEAWVRHWEGRISRAGGSGDPEGDAAPVAEAGPKASARKAKAR
jgi:asparagine synthase (glutamine-hydrolysing)